MSTRPSSPAAAEANTLFARPGVGTCTGADQLVPSFVEYAYQSAVSPASVPLYGACSQIAYRLPAASIASDGKLAPVRTPVPRFATGRSVQLRPLGSLTFWSGAPNATGKHRAIWILLRPPSSWITYTRRTGAASVVARPLTSCPVVVAAGLT